jgi:crossover junction endodeoxyribonuclease RuvC
VKTILGIDPGASGGIAWITDGKPCVEKMPDTLQDLWELIENITGALPHRCKAYLEQVHSMPGQGVASSFKFGQGYGALEMALTAVGIAFERVTPQKWQKALGCLTKGDKNVSKRKAQELFPTMKVTHATADALLIAEWGRRQNL